MAVRRIVRPPVKLEPARPPRPESTTPAPFAKNDPRLTPEAQAASRAAVAQQKSTAVVIAKQVLPAETPLISKAGWKQFVSLVAGGAKVPAALEAVGLPTEAYRRMMKAEPKLAAQVDDARRAAARIGWDEELIERILARVARGGIVKDIVAEEGKSVDQFYGLILKDPEIKELYDAARTIAMEGMIDDILEEAGNDGSDMTFDGKGNSAAVNRSRLQIETRQWLMERLNRSRFAPKVQEQEIHVTVNTVEKLEDARKRSADRHKRVVSTVEKNVTPRLIEQ